MGEMTGARLTEIPVFFYRTLGGAEPVLGWLRHVPAEDRRVIGTDLATVQWGLADWDAVVPAGGLWEVRSRSASRPIARLLFFVDAGWIGVVHGFFKETQKTLPEDIALARQRMKDMM